MIVYLHVMSSESPNFIKGSKRTSLIRHLKKSAQTNEHKVHVVHFKGMWGIKEEGKDKFTRKYRTKTSAVKNAREIAQTSNATALVIHGLDGRVTSYTAIAQ